MSVYARVDIEGFLYRSVNGHPTSGSPRAFLGLGSRFWCVLRADQGTFVLHKGPKDTLIKGKHARPPMKVEEMTVEEHADEPTGFTIRISGGEQEIYLVCADQAERAKWVSGLKRNGAKTYEPPAEQASVAEAARQGLLKAQEMAQEQAAQLASLAEAEKQVTWQEKQLAGKKGTGKSYRPAAVYDRVLSEAIDKALENVGVFVFNSIKDPYMPRWMLKAIDKAHEEVWDDVEVELKDIVLSSIAIGDEETKLYNEMRLKHWAQTFPRFWPSGHCCPNPYNYFRAHFLYAILPADQTTWQKLHSPVTVFFMVMAATSYYAINVWLFVVLFCLMDKRDEYQLVSFILKFKGFQFISGIIAAIKASILLYECVDVPGMCAHTAPGTKPSFHVEIAAEPVRILVVWLAFLLLWCGHARGGREEIIALETVRVDAADGDLDGKRDVDKLRKGEASGKMGQASVDLDDDEVIAATEAARTKYGVATKYGGWLGWFMIYDIVAFLLVGVGIGEKMYRGGYTTEDWMFYLSLFYYKACYALLSFPFLLFSVPVLGSILGQAKPTAYDRMGVLCPKLSASQVAKKMNIEREMWQRRQEREHRPGIAKAYDKAATNVGEGVASAYGYVRAEISEIPPLSETRSYAAVKGAVRSVADSRAVAAAGDALRTSGESLKKGALSVAGSVSGSVSPYSPKDQKELI